MCHSYDQEPLRRSLFSSSCLFAATDKTGGIIEELIRSWICQSLPNTANLTGPLSVADIGNHPAILFKFGAPKILPGAELCDQNFHPEFVLA